MVSSQSKDNQHRLLSVVKGLGFRMVFIAGPLAVPTSGNSTELYEIYINGNESLQCHSVKEVRDGIMFLMYIIFGWCAFLFLCILVYIPANPLHPPSKTAAVSKVNQTTGLKRFIQNKNFWMVAIAFVLPYGTQIGWGSVLDVNLNKIGISQTMAGWLGFTAGIIGNICILLAGKFAEVFRRKMKIIIILFYTLSAPFFLVFMLLYTKIIPFSEVLLWITLIFGI